MPVKFEKKIPIKISLCRKLPKMRLLTLIAVIFSSPFAQGANIFTFFPTVMHSHYVFAKPLLQELSRNGHNLTILTFKSIGYKSDTYREIIPTMPEGVLQNWEGKFEVKSDHKELLFK